MKRRYRGEKRGRWLGRSRVAALVGCSGRASTAATGFDWRLDGCSGMWSLVVLIGDGESLKPGLVYGTAAVFPPVTEKDN